MNSFLATMAATVGTLALASPSAAQEISPNAPKFVKSVKAPGLEVRFLDFRWDEEAFRSLEQGGSHPAARRSWVLARLMLQTDPLKWNGKLVPVGPALLVLNPKKGNEPATMEIRYIDMREVFVDMNVIAEPPEGETYAKAPANFAKVDTTLPRLDVTLKDNGQSYDLGVQYGNRKTMVTLTR
jgi:hypothetical protein